MAFPGRFSQVVFKCSTTVIYKPTAASWTSSTRDTRVCKDCLSTTIRSKFSRDTNWISRDWIGFRHLAVNLEDAPATSTFYRTRCIWRVDEAANTSIPSTPPRIIAWCKAWNPPLSEENLLALPLKVPVAFPAFIITMTVKVARDRNITKIFSLCRASILPWNTLEILLAYPKGSLDLFHIPETVLEIML